MKIRPILALLTACTLLCGCSAQIAETTAPAPSGEASAAATAGAVITDSSDLFSNRDYEEDYDSSKAALIQLNGSSASCGSSAVSVDGASVTITDAGTYILSGTLENGMIIVDAEKTDKVRLVLDNAVIHSRDCAALYILQADKVFLTLADGTANTLSNGGSFTPIDENNIDAALFSKEDLTMNGTGSLTVTSPAGHGIVSKDELTITGGSYSITCASHGMTGKDSICIDGASITVAAGKDGIHTENVEDTALGYLYIENGSFDITAEGDGISAGAWLQIQNGSFQILCGGGSKNAQQQTSDAWGGFGGGMGGPGGRPGGGGIGSPGGRGGNGETPPTPASEEDSTSIKAVKASGDLVINGGSFSIDAADDAIHSNNNATVNGGSFQITTGDDGFHADNALTINGGGIVITESYEGLEGLSILINSGSFDITASDDGLNAAGGADQSGFGGFRGNEGFGPAGNSDSFITIAGGEVYINASGDGIDSNGTFEISGGSVTVCGPTQGDTAVLDYDSSGIITGGTFIGTGSYMMAQTFSDSEQGVIALSVGSQSAGTQITLKDAKGNAIFSYAPALPFAIVILSSPEMVKGETYTITVGSASGAFEAS